MARKNILWGVAVGAVLVVGSAGGAFAGEIGGNGQPTQGAAHSRSLCAFSGLEDAPEETGQQVQNWGHIPQEARKDWSTRGASVVDTPFGEQGCNAHLYPNK
ncbi:hypothetical protein [Microbacterium sp. SS28]|uniref:hypothetical protein n=1 Tax=Microbacterium sp. SS28 TaxID=2919948 RepID=UPI001FAA5094|nr:hypothetical protein [Microbacterium sp. SS28]